MHINMHNTLHAHQHAQHTAIPSPLPSSTLLCTQLTNTKPSWQNGTRCRDGVNVLWCRSHLVRLVFERSIPTCACFPLENFFGLVYNSVGSYIRFTDASSLVHLVHRSTGSPGAPVHWFTWCTGALVHLHGAPVHWCTGSPGALVHLVHGALVHLVHRCTGAPVHSFTGSPGALVHWFTWCTGALVHLVHRCTGSPGASAPVNLVHWFTWCTGALVHLHGAPVHWFT